MEDLRAVGDSVEAAAILHIAHDDLRPESNSEIEGPLLEHPHMRYRRCIPLTDLPSFVSFEIDDDTDTFRHQACDYVLIYRALTSDELINFKMSGDVLVIIRVLNNSQLAPYIAAAYA